MEFLMHVKAFMLNALCVLWLGVILIGCIYFVEKAMQMQHEEDEKKTTNVS